MKPEAVAFTPASSTPSVSQPALWIGRVLSGLSIAFMVMDGVMKLVQPVPVVQASVKLGLSSGTTAGIGVVLLVSNLLYAIPRTAVLGAMLLTGFLGGAVAMNIRAGNPPFETAFPVIFAVLVWGGLYLRDARLRALVSLRSNDL